MVEKTNLFLMKQELKELERQHAEKQKMEKQLWLVEKELEDGVASTVRLRELMRAKHTLDHEIDRFDEVDREMIEELKKRMFSSLIEKFPEMRSKIEETLTVLDAAQNERLAIENTEEYLADMQRSLIEIDNAHKHATSFFGFLYSIFGKSPTAQITNQMKNLAKNAQSLQALLSHEITLSEDFSDTSLTFINFILVEAKERWSFKSIKKFKERFPIEIHSFKELLNKFKEKNESKITDLESQLEGWMEKE